MTIEEMKQRKKQLGYSYEKIASLSGVPLGTVQKVLGGITKSPRYETVRALESVLGAEAENQKGTTVPGSPPDQDVGGLAEETAAQTKTALLDKATTDAENAFADPSTGQTAAENGRRHFLQEGEGVYSASSLQNSCAGTSVVREGAYLYGAHKEEVPEQEGYGLSGKKQGEYTLEDYYALPDDKRAELINGVIYDMAAPTVIHQILSAEIWRVFSDYIRRNKGQCIALTAPVDVQIKKDKRNMVQPDVLIVCAREKLKRRVVYGAPDLTVEILSKSTRSKDLIIKLNTYFESGVKEYWIVDPDEKRITVYQFEECIRYKIYEGSEEVPVGIFQDQCRVNFKELFEYVSFLEEEDEE